MSWSLVDYSLPKQELHQALGEKSEFLLGLDFLLFIHSVRVYIYINQIYPVVTQNDVLPVLLSSFLFFFTAIADLLL